MRSALRWVPAIAGASLLLGCARPAGTNAAATPRGSAAARLAVDVYGSGAPSASAATPPAVAFEVIAVDDLAEPERVVATGRTGQDVVSVPAGVVLLAVALDPPERIGPFRLHPGDAARVRILDTLDAAMPSRIWRLERGDEVVGRAFPPPDELPARSAP